MGLILKKEELGSEDDFDIIERSDTPEDLPRVEYDLVSGESAEDIAARNEEKPDLEAELAPDPELLGDAASAVAATAAAASSSKEADENASKKRGKKKDAPVAKGDSNGAGGKGGNGAGGNGGNGGKKGRRLPKNHGTIGIAIAVILVIVAGIGGYFIGNGGFAGKGPGAAAVEESQLDTVLARWSFNGKTTNLTVREAIESQYSLENAKDDDGKYAVPTAEVVVAYVRNQILLADAESRGITVDEDEMSAFAEEQLGSSDYSTIASQYGVSEDQAKQVVKENATIKKLTEQVVPDAPTGSVPVAPTEPADGNAETASKDYADYIINLAGDEWDSEKGTWASKDGTFYNALSSSTTFSADSATYADAQLAYYAAYQQYAEQGQSASNAWRAYVNDLYAKADVSLYGLYI